MAGPQILIAEDEVSLRNLLFEALTEKGLRVVQAANGLHASQILKDNRGISVLLSDARMPRIDGYAFVEYALLHNPQLKVLMMAEYPGQLPPPDALKAREIVTVVKPFTMDDMCERVIGMLAWP